MVVLDASRRIQRIPRLAQCSLGVGIVATVGANLAHGLGHGPVGALVSAWPALALVGSYELLMLLIRSSHQVDAEHLSDDPVSHGLLPVAHGARMHSAHGTDERLMPDGCLRHCSRWLAQTHARTVSSPPREAEMSQPRSSVPPEGTIRRTRSADRPHARSARLIGGMGVVAVLSVGLMAGSASAGSSAVTSALRPGPTQRVAAWAGSGMPPAGLQQAANQLVADGAPGVIILSRSGPQVSDVVAGLADTATSRSMQAQDKVHIGSITKSFVATVVLQLAAEGRLSLDDNMQHLLPGVLSAPGYDPARITVRQLLQQTSGIPDYLNDTALFGNPNSLQPYEQTWQPQQLVDIALSLGPPTSGWEYSNTNYILLGMIIQKVTGQSPITEISNRILQPLGLHSTSFPLTSTAIPAPYAHGYYGSQDVTNLVNPSLAWTAGAMISTVSDVATFYRALLTGRLLPPAYLQQMLSAVPVDDAGELFPQHYGLGIYSVQLSCGTAWGHDGGWPGGFITIAYTSPDGSRQAVMIYNSYTMGVQPPAGTETAAFVRDQKKALEVAFCGTLAHQ